MAFIEDVVIVSAVLYEMIRRDVHKGNAALCLDGGNAMGLAVER
jgi:acetyl-CoA C-acetyltransferase